MAVFINEVNGRLICRGWTQRLMHLTNESSEIYGCRWQTFLDASDSNSCSLFRSFLLFGRICYFLGKNKEGRRTAAGRMKEHFTHLVPHVILWKYNYTPDVAPNSEEVILGSFLSDDEKYTGSRRSQLPLGLYGY